MTLYRCADPRIGWRRACCRTGKVNPERKRLLLVVPQAVMLHRQAGVRTGGIGRRKSCCRTGNFSSGKENPVCQKPGPDPENTSGDPRARPSAQGEQIHAGKTKRLISFIF